MEKIINVPLDDETKRRLEDRADANGRATSREAAAIIRKAVKADGAKGGDTVAECVAMMKRHETGGKGNGRA